jgi:hypothetical protein
MLRTLLALLLLATPVLAQRPPAPPEDRLLRPGGREGYVVDASNGCWAWMSGMRPETTDLSYTWTGTCPEGRAEGTGRSTLTWRERGVEKQMIHEGTLRAGKAVGRGTLAHMEDGEAVVLESGEFADDMLVNGRIEVPRAGLVYEGQVLRGQPNGTGRITVRGRVFEGEWRLGCLQVGPEIWLAFGRPAESCRAQDL